MTVQALYNTGKVTVVKALPDSYGMNERVHELGLDSTELRNHK